MTLDLSLATAAQLVAACTIANVTVVQKFHVSWRSRWFPAAAPGTAPRPVQVADQLRAKSLGQQALDRRAKCGELRQHVTSSILDLHAGPSEFTGA
jgi:hypothetical protein